MQCSNIILDYHYAYKVVRDSKEKKLWVITIIGRHQFVDRS